MPSDKFTVLVVDDVPENIDVLRACLGDIYHVKAAPSGEIALKILNSLPVDIALLDVMMPQMSGFELCQTMKANPATQSIPVIFVTTRDDECDEEYGFSIGAVDYLSKPVKPAVVRSRLKTHLALHQQQRMLEQMVADRTRELEQIQFDLIRRLGQAAEYKDNETGMHVIRVGEYARCMALHLGFSQADADALCAAAPMHDIGKLGIPDAILLKPGKLTPDEFEEIKKHSNIGGELLGGSDYHLLNLAARIAESHHEKWDGSGYPNGLKGDAIPLEGRIVTICDVFDALSCVRPYKKSWPLEQVVEHFKSESGRHFDPILVNVFQELLPRFVEIMNQYRD